MKALIAALAPATLALATSGAAQTVPAARLSPETPIAQIAADPKGKAVLDADFPGLTAHPMYEQFKGMTLTQLAPMSQGKITDASIAKARTDLAAIK